MKIVFMMTAMFGCAASKYAEGDWVTARDESIGESEDIEGDDADADADADADIDADIDADADADSDADTDSDADSDDTGEDLAPVHTQMTFTGEFVFTDSVSWDGGVFCKIVAWPMAAVDSTTGELDHSRGETMFGQETVRCPSGPGTREEYRVELMVSRAEATDYVALFGKVESVESISEVATSSNPVAVDANAEVGGVDFIFGL